MTPIPRLAPYTRAQLHQDIQEGRPDWAEPATPLTRAVMATWSLGQAMARAVARLRELAARVVAAVARLVPALERVARARAGVRSPSDPRNWRVPTRRPAPLTPRAPQPGPDAYTWTAPRRHSLGQP